MNPQFETNPFEEQSIQELLRFASGQGIVVCVIFDQFEEIIHRTELAPVFERMKALALAADESQEPFVVGFSWKTDGTVGSDYPGYFLWHSLSDRRKDFHVDKFAREDADNFIVLAQRESKQQLRKNVVRFIIENYAGFPWLLKKLVRHYIDDARQNGGGSPISSLLTLESLFQNDLQELTEAERRIVKFVAQHSPVEFGSVAEKYGNSAVESLISRRLIINTGGQLILYWDIFKDYILYEEVPHLTNTYVPTISVRKLRSIIRSLLENDELRYADLASELGISLPTADNVVRDLTNLGLVSANRSEQFFQSRCDSAVAATGKIKEFLNNQAIFIKADNLIRANRTTTFHEICEAAKVEYDFISLDDRTMELYTRKILLYCLQFGLINKEGNNFFLGEPVDNILEAVGRTAKIAEVDLFRAAAPPERVVELIEALRSRSIKNKADAEKVGLRNAVFAASTIGLVQNKGGELSLVQSALKGRSAAEIVRSSVMEIEPFKNGFASVRSSSLSADELGAYIADLYLLNWSPGSCKRHGWAFKRWLSWLEQ